VNLKGHITVGIVISLMAMPGMSGVANAQSMRLVGSGASFPFPLYATWFQAFSSQSGGVTVDYQAKGSGAGIQDFINEVVDFAASDAAMTDEQIAQVKRGVVLLPMTAGEIVLAYNLEGVDELKLPRDVYPEIFLGTVERWNDPKIVEANPDVELPDLPITVVRRSDSSGTNFVFTKHLSAIDPDFANGPGSGTTVQWPQSDRFVAAPKNDGVTATVAQTPGAIGYIEYGYAKLTGTKSALLENSSGNFIAAGEESGTAALASAEFPADGDLRVWVEDPSAPDAYPIATFTWMLFYQEQDPAKAEVLRNLVEFGLTEGQKMAPELGYIPLPDNVIEKVREASAKIQ
jgi:phosphate transport system substrate-binding protein